MRKQLSIQEYLTHPVVDSARGEAGYKPSTIGYPAHAGTAPCPSLHAQRTRIHTGAGQRVQRPSSTTRATLSARCCTKPLPGTSRPGTRWQVQARSTASAHCGAGATTTHPPAPLLWCARPEFSAQGCGDGAGDTGTTGQASRGAGRASRHGRGRTGSDTAGPCEPTHARTCDTQTRTCGRC